MSKCGYSIKYEIKKLNKASMLFFAILFLACAIITRMLCKSPLLSLNYNIIKGTIPPISVFVILFSIFYLLLGVSFGAAIGTNEAYIGDYKYKGSMWLIITLFLSLAFYPVFFSVGKLFLSLIITMLCLFSAIISAICYYRVSKVAFVSLIFPISFLIYLLIINIKIFFVA